MRPELSQSGFAEILLDVETPGLVDAATMLGDGPKRVYRKLWDAVQLDAWCTGDDGRRYKTLSAPVNYTSLANALGKSESQTRRDMNALEAAGLILQARLKDRTLTPTVYDPRQVLVAEINALTVAAGEYQPALPGMEKGAPLRLFQPEPFSHMRTDDAPFANARADLRTEATAEPASFAHMRTEPPPFANMRANMRTPTQQEQQGVVRDVLAHLISARTRPNPRKSLALSNHQSQAQEPTGLENRTTKNLSTPAPGERLDGLIHQIEASITDPAMDPWIAERLAWAVCAGRLSARRLRDTVRYVAGKHARGEIRTSPGALLNSLGKRLARIHRFPWCPVGGDRRQDDPYPFPD